MNMEKMSKLEKDHKALELRLAGNTYEDISTELGYATRSASYKAVLEGRFLRVEPIRNQFLAAKRLLHTQNL